MKQETKAKYQETIKTMCVSIACLVWGLSMHNGCQNKIKGDKQSAQTVTKIVTDTIKQNVR